MNDRHYPASNAINKEKATNIQPSPKLNSSFLGMPIGPLWAHKGPILGKKLIILIKIDKNSNKI